MIPNHGTKLANYRIPPLQLTCETFGRTGGREGCVKCGLSLCLSVCLSLSNLAFAFAFATQIWLLHLELSGLIEKMLFKMENYKT